MVSFSDPFFIAFAVILIIINLCFMFLLKLVIEKKILKKTDASAQTAELADPQTEAHRTESKTKMQTLGLSKKAEAARPTQTETFETEVKLKTQEKQTEETGLLKRVRKTVKNVTRKEPKKEPRNGKADFCPKFLGYLHTLPKGSGYPDECLRCRKIISCMGVQGGEAIEEFYADKAVAE